MLAKNKLKNIIKSASLMLNDVDTFLLMRSEFIKNFEEFEISHGIGGGNFLSLIGQFAIINFLSKIYCILKKGESAFISQKQIDEWKELKDKLKKKEPGFWEEIKKYYEKNKPRLGEMNESEAFVLFINDCPVKILANKKDTEKIWKYFRNKISHLALPKGKVATTKFYKYSFLEAKESVKKSNEAAIKDNICDVDLLNYRIKEAIEWLENEIDKRKNRQKVITIIKWHDNQFV